MRRSQFLSWRDYGRPDPRDIRDSRDLRGDLRSFRDRDPRDIRDTRDVRDLRDPRDIRDPRDVRDPRDRDLYDRELRDRYRDPYRDRDLYDRRPAVSEPLESADKGPVDCEIIVASRAQKQYAEMVDRRIRGMSMTSSFMFLSMEVTLKSALESATRKGILYAVVVTNQHEMHQSVTVNILHGTPQEHRNMPLDDALTLIGRNFDRYIQDMREKRERALIGSNRPLARGLSPPRASSSVDLTLPQLLNLLADGRQLTLPELDRVIEFLQDVRSKLARELGVSTPATKPAAATPAAVRSEPKLPVDDSALQAKILSIFKSQVATSLVGNPSLTAAAAAAAAVAKTPSPAPAVVAQPSIAQQAQLVAQQALQQMAQAKKPPAPVMQTAAPPQAQLAPKPLPTSVAAQPNMARPQVMQVPQSMAHSPRMAMPQRMTAPQNATQPQNMVAKNVSASVAGLNLDNPNIQKALENLIQNGPNLLKNLSNAPQPPAQQGQKPPLPSQSVAPPTAVQQHRMNNAGIQRMQGPAANSPTPKMAVPGNPAGPRVAGSPQVNPMMAPRMAASPQGVRQVAPPQMRPAAPQTQGQRMPQPGLAQMAPSAAGMQRTPSQMDQIRLMQQQQQAARGQVQRWPGQQAYYQQ